MRFDLEDFLQELETKRSIILAPHTLHIEEKDEEERPERKKPVLKLVVNNPG